MAQPIAEPDVRAERGAEQQPADRLDERRERLVLGEALQPLRHRPGRHEAAAEQGQHGQDERQVAGRLDRLRLHPHGDPDPAERERDQHDQTGGGEPLDRPRRRAEADQQADAEHQRDRDDRLDGVAEHVPGEHRGPRDRHRAEPGGDALGHVHRDRDRDAADGAGDGDQQDAGHDVREVRLPPAGRVDAGQAGAERAAEHEHRQQQDDDRPQDGEHRQAGVAHDVQQVAAQHRDRVADDVRLPAGDRRCAVGGDGGHDSVPFVSSEPERPSCR